MQLMCTLVFYSMESDYPREVLGHGGVNVFPSAEGTCEACDLFVRVANPNGPITCPICGGNIELHVGMTYGEWSYARGGSYDTCDFIMRAARSSNRIPVIPAASR